jgi:hypothetical protein
MTALVLILLGVEKAKRAREHDRHFLWAAGKFLKCARMAGAIGWLS